MNMQERMEANAIIERLTEKDEPFFYEDDARRLIELIPVTKPKRFTLKMGYQSNSSSSEGYAAGVGNVSLQDEGEKVDKVLVGGEKVWKVGGYEVEHRPGVLTITKMWGRDAMGEAEQECRIQYNRLKCTMHHAQDRTLTIHIPFTPVQLSFSYTSYPVWKRSLSSLINPLSPP